MTISQLVAGVMAMAAAAAEQGEGPEAEQLAVEPTPAAESGAEIETQGAYNEAEVTTMTTQIETQATETTTTATEGKKARKVREPKAPKAEAAPKAPKAPRVRKPKAAPEAQAVCAAETVEAPAGPKYKGGADNGFPFLSKAQIVAKAAEDRDYRVKLALIMDGRQTEDEREVKTTKYRNRCGWMSSDAHRGSHLAQALATGAELTLEQEGFLSIVPQKYRKQLANHFRAEALAADEALAEKAKVFGL